MLGTILIAVALPLLLLAKGFFSGSEIALVNADRIHLQHLAREGHRGAKLALRLLKTPELLLSTTLIGTNIATVLLVTIGTSLAMDIAGPGGDAYAVFLLAPVLLILGEVVPKSVYQQRANKLAPTIIFPLWSLSLLLTPFTYAFSGIAKMIARASGVAQARPAVLVTRNMIRAVVRMADRASGLESFDRDRIDRATHFADRRAGEAVIPMSDVPTVPSSATMQTVLDIVAQKGVYRVAVHDGDVTRVTGIVALSPWDVLEGVETTQPVGERALPPLFVLPGQRASDLVPALLDRADRMAVVIGEQGQALGAVTLEGVLAAVSGPFDAGFHSAPRGLDRFSEVDVRHEDECVVGGRVSLATLAETLDLELASSSVYTVGGLLNERLGRIGAVGDRVPIEDWTAEVLEATPTEIHRVRFVRTRPTRAPRPEAET